jgi:hypothetical protein
MKKRKPRSSNGNAMKNKWADPVWRNKMIESRDDRIQKKKDKK